MVHSGGTRFRFLSWILASIFFSSLCWLAWQLWTMRLPHEAFLGIAVHDYYWAIVFAVTAGIALIWRHKPSGSQFTVGNLLLLTTLIAVCLGAVSAIQQRATLHLAFRRSVSDLDHLADRVQAARGAEVKLNVRAGWYQIRSGKNLPGAVFLETHPWPNPESGYGFLRYPNAKTNRIDGRTLGLSRAGFLHLGGEWYVVYDLYEWYKIGWS